MLKIMKNKIKDSSNKIEFSEKHLWKHKDGSMELLPTMPTTKLQKVILPEIRKRLEEKRASVALFQEKLQICNEILVSRGVLTQQENVNDAVINAIKKFPIEIVEQALEQMMEEERVRFNKNRVH
jgi:predicted rRNA methylase YqxC with S4 and FtsJ domains